MRNRDNAYIQKMAHVLPCRRYWHSANKFDLQLFNRNVSLQDNCSSSAAKLMLLSMSTQKQCKRHFACLHSSRRCISPTHISKSHILTIQKRTNVRTWNQQLPTAGVTKRKTKLKVCNKCTRSFQVNRSRATFSMMQTSEILSLPHGSAKADPTHRGSLLLTLVDRPGRNYSKRYNRGAPLWILLTRDLTGRLMPPRWASECSVWYGGPTNTSHEKHLRTSTNPSICGTCNS